MFILELIRPKTHGLWEDSELLEIPNYNLNSPLKRTYSTIKLVYSLNEATHRILIKCYFVYF